MRRGSINHPKHDFNEICLATRPTFICAVQDGVVLIKVPHAAGKSSTLTNRYANSCSLEELSTSRNVLALKAGPLPTVG